MPLPLSNPPHEHAHDFRKKSISDFDIDTTQLNEELQSTSPVPFSNFNNIDPDDTLHFTNINDLNTDNIQSNNSSNSNPSMPPSNETKTETQHANHASNNKIAENTDTCKYPNELFPFEHGNNQRDHRLCDAHGERKNRPLLVPMARMA